MEVEDFKDRHGFVHAGVVQIGVSVLEISVPGAFFCNVAVPDPLFGEAYEIIKRQPGPLRAAENPQDNVVTTMSVIDWKRPTEIPAIAKPGKLPPGVGGAIMNVLAILAQRAGVTELRYAGPYPTNTLFSTLARSFRTTTSEEEFTSAFADRAARLARDPMDAVFVPAPHERIAIVEGIEQDVRGIIEIRDRIERATIDGVVYSRGGGVTRLVETLDIGEIKRTHDVRGANDARVRAEVWFADELYAHVATFAADGELLEGPHPIPACESDVIGKAFPPEMVAALAELVAELVTPALAKAATHVVAGRTLRWADLGARPAARVGDELQLHAALWRLAPRGMARLAMALVEALVPIVGPLAASTMIASR